MLYHYTFNTYKNKCILIDGDVLSFLKGIFYQIACEKGFQIIECEILSDHVHMLIDQEDGIEASFVMKNIKGISSRRLFQKYNVNRYEFRKLWARSYNVRKVDDSQRSVAVGYIKSQKSETGIDKRFV